MSERLSDEQVARLRSGYAAYGCFIVDAAKVDAALADLQACRALLNGGPCETCGDMPHPGWIEYADAMANHETRCPDCVKGHRPGVIERLELIEDQLLDRRMRPDATDDLAAVIALLREAVPGE